MPDDSDVDELPDRIAPIVMAATVPPGSRPKPAGGKQTGGESIGSAAGPVKRVQKRVVLLVQLGIVTKM